MNEKEQEFTLSPQLKQVLAIICVCLLVILPLLFFRAMADKAVDNVTESVSLQFSQELNAQMSTNIANNIHFYQNELNTIGNVLSSANSLTEDTFQAFITKEKEDNGYSYLSFADSDGYVYEESGTYLGTVRISILGKLLNGSATVLADTISIGNESYVLMGTRFQEPIVVGDHCFTIGFIGMTVEDLAATTDLHSDYSGGFSSIMNTDGSYVVKNPLETNDGLNVFSILLRGYNCSNEDIMEIREKVQAGDSFQWVTTNTETGDTVYLYFAPISNTTWYLISTLPDTFINQSLEELTSAQTAIYSVLVGFYLLVGAIVFFLQARSSSKLRKSREQLSVALESAESANNAKTSFLFSMSHDIRTPMNAILGYADIGLKHNEENDILVDSLKKIKGAGTHLLGLINDILEMSRIESGKMKIDPVPVDMLDAIDGVKSVVDGLATSKSIDFQVDFSDITDHYVYNDVSHINEVIINLLSNAVKFTPNGGKIRYTALQITKPENGQARYRFIISDNGVGMSRKFQKEMYEAFSREENPSTAKTEGSGLGLSIVKRIVDLCGGTIQCQSQPDKGTTFTLDFTFPLMDEEAIAEFKKVKEKATAPKQSCLDGKRVLLVEDNEMNREIATELLEDVGITVETAEDGQIAVTTVNQRGVGYFDFILMDIQMPIMNGYQATEEIRKLPAGKFIPIIALSANAFEEDKKKSLQAGMNAHVAKPINVKELMETIQNLVR